MIEVLYVVLIIRQAVDKEWSAFAAASVCQAERNERSGRGSERVSAALLSLSCCLSFTASTDLMRDAPLHSAHPPPPRRPPKQILREEQQQSSQQVDQSTTVKKTKTKQEKPPNISSFSFPSICSRRCRLPS